MQYIKAFIKLRINRVQLIFFILIPLILSLAHCALEDEPTTGKNIYKVYCVNCHGVDGSLGTNAAMDLSRSQLSLEGRKEIIKNGRVTMMGFAKVLSPAQIDSVALYTLKLGK